MSRFRTLPPMSVLLTFEAVSRLESFRQAANELGVTPSAVSHQIKQLEEQMGLPLFERTASGNRLTEDGARFAETIRSAFAVIEEGTDGLQGQPEVERVSLLCANNFGERLFKQALDLFCAENSTIEVDLKYAAEQQTQQGVTFDSSDYDAAIIWGNGVWTGTKNIRIYETRLSVWGSDELVAKPHKNPERLADYPWVISRIFPMQWIWATQCLGVPDLQTKKEQLWVDSNQEWVELVVKGKAIGIAESGMIENAPFRDRIRRVVDIMYPSYDYYLVYPDNRQMRPGMAKLAEWLELYAAEKWLNKSLQMKSFQPAD